MPKIIVIAGGGTGGHLYPGVALARSIMKIDSDAQVTFVGTKRGLESRVLPKERLPLHTIDADGLVGKVGVKKWVSLCKVPVALAQSMCFLIQKKPDLVVGVGGYVSGPLVLSAWTLRIPILIHEQNAFPGVTNRMLGRLADVVAISFEKSARFFSKDKVQITGNMIRESFAKASPPKPLKTDAPVTLLILGGSQGAHSINKAMVDALGHLENHKDQLRFVHQTGEKDLQTVKSAYEQKGFNCEVAAFFYDMDEKYKKASLVLCRAGATTLAEITACGKVSLLVPYPFATHNHQEHNARVLETAGAGKILLDQEVDGAGVADWIKKFLIKPEDWMTQAQNSYKLGRRDATSVVRDLCENLISRSGKSHRAQSSV